MKKVFKVWIQTVISSDGAETFQPTRHNCQTLKQAEELANRPIPDPPEYNVGDPWGEYTEKRAKWNAGDYIPMWNGSVYVNPSQHPKGYFISAIWVP